jgi:hypothetical protein
VSTITTDKLSLIGWLLILVGSELGIVGGIINALTYHNLAIDLWLWSNLFLLIWAVGFIKGWWNKKISVEALALMYFVFTLCNIYAVLMR